MRALVLDGEGIRLDRSFPAPIPSAGEALVRVTLAGICSTDLEILKGYMGFRGVPGHEFVGVVEELDAPGEAQEWNGKRVVGEINLPCGACGLCSEGLGKHCRARRVLGIQGKDGAFAEHLTIPLGNLHAVPDPVSDEEAVFTEPLAAAFQVLEQVEVHPGDEVAVFGDGRLGNLVAQVLKQAGARVEVVGKHPEKLALMAGLGIRTTPLERFEGHRRLVVDCTGSPGGFRTALSAVRPSGTLVQKSTFASELAFNPSGMVVDEVTVVGSRCGPFARALEALEEGVIATRSLLSGRFRLEDWEEAFRAAQRGGKVLLGP